MLEFFLKLKHIPIATITLENARKWISIFSNGFPFWELELDKTLNFWDKCANKNLVQVSPSFNHCKGPKAHVSKVGSYFPFGDLKLASKKIND
jgi:hypothetical protein